MLPTLILSAPRPGILYLNGRFAGEIGPDEVLARPVQPRGALYLDYRPLNAGWLGMARRLVFSGGEPMARSAEEAEGVDIVIWPGGAVELELTPAPLPGPAQRFRAAGREFALEASGSLLCDGRTLAALPPGAGLPEYRALPGGAAFTGPCDGGGYLLTTDSELRRQTGLLRARRIDIDLDGGIRALVARDDQLGHATLEHWRLTPEGLSMDSSEPAWADGAPRRPSTAAGIARAAVEAALAGLDGEAEGYLTPALRERAPLRGIREACDLCVEMKYAPLDPRPCVGLLKLETANLARVRPLYYRAIPSGGLQGSYLIEALELE